MSHSATMRSKTKLYVDGLLLVYYLLLWFVDTVAERYKRTESDKKLWEGRRASPLTPGKPTAKKNSNKPHFARVQIALVVMFAVALIITS